MSDLLHSRTQGAVGDPGDDAAEGPPGPKVSLHIFVCECMNYSPSVHLIVNSYLC